MLLLELMSLNELKENIKILRNQLFEAASLKGYSDFRTNQIRTRLDFYLKKYNELSKLNNKK